MIDLSTLREQDKELFESEMPRDIHIFDYLDCNSNHTIVLELQLQRQIGTRTTI